MTDSSLPGFGDFDLQLPELSDPGHFVLSAVVMGKDSGGVRVGGGELERNVSGDLDYVGVVGFESEFSESTCDREIQELQSDIEGGALRNGKLVSTSSIETLEIPTHESFAYADSGMLPLEEELPSGELSLQQLPAVHQPTPKAEPSQVSAGRSGTTKRAKQSKKSAESRSPGLSSASSTGSPTQFVPSRFCHICARKGRSIRFATCANLALGTCRKVMCERCCDVILTDPVVVSSNNNATGHEQHQVLSGYEAAIANSSWQCTHCEKSCPSHARCHLYSRTNSKRVWGAAAIAAQAHQHGQASANGCLEVLSDEKENESCKQPSPKRSKVDRTAANNDS
mmetsp:Transcript_12041/g.26292  ORF Transcript_12041/g.26292 Transcript_12041/m.26292 type:complete len:340 (-) Transcript_12041:281-1300(-)|eukprot:CAMPEP_0185847894 /NCGR_PEP_ID=MMETSP1354-20130828/2978_1 /TAXON_ID=708628 /ORGANISM="Erythrolobus madagascarensis, Strain CCMP3276" /LENGTH=339 /DNA_ID=CAMNT_0028548229 /DNA_START=325 /DNA_END=1344 /DNA_ORIENTATION=-